MMSCISEKFQNTSNQIIFLSTMKLFHTYPNYNISSVNEILSLFLNILDP